MKKVWKTAIAMFIITALILMLTACSEEETTLLMSILTDMTESSDLAPAAETVPAGLEPAGTWECADIAKAFESYGTERGLSEGAMEELMQKAEGAAYVMELYTDGTYRMTMTITGKTAVETGCWAESMGQITLTADSGKISLARWENGQLMLTANGVTYAFGKTGTETPAVEPEVTAAAEEPVVEVTLAEEAATADVAVAVEEPVVEVTLAEEAATSDVAVAVEEPVVEVIVDSRNVAGAWKCVNFRDIAAYFAADEDISEEMLQFAADSCSLTLTLAEDGSYTLSVNLGGDVQSTVGMWTENENGVCLDAYTSPIPFIWEGDRLVSDAGGVRMILEKTEIGEGTESAPVLDPVGLWECNEYMQATAELAARNGMSAEQTDALYSMWNDFPTRVVIYGNGTFTLYIARNEREIGYNGTWTFDGYSVILTLEERERVVLHQDGDRFKAGYDSQILTFSRSGADARQPENYGAEQPDGYGADAYYIGLWEFDVVETYTEMMMSQGIPEEEARRQAEEIAYESYIRLDIRADHTCNVIMINNGELYDEDEATWESYGNGVTVLWSTDLVLTRVGDDLICNMGTQSMTFRKK